MKTFNRILYIICATCVTISTVLVLVAMWAETKDETIWKIVGSASVILLASGIMLVINFYILKMKAEMEDKET